MSARTKPKLFLSAGEASGDHYGAQVIAGLRELLPSATFSGLGGVEMESAGQQRVVRAEDVAHMGITEVIRHMPRVYGEYRRLVGWIRRERPDAAVLIDFPDVNFRLAKHLKRLGVPVIWFVSPQLWAWKRSRLRWVQQRVNKMLVIFPFEEAFYRARGVNAAFVGHPLAELPLPTVSRKDYAARYGLDPGKRWIALLPGSREKEIAANLGELIGMAMRSPEMCEYLIPVASTIDASRLAGAVEEEMKRWGRRGAGSGPGGPAAGAKVKLVPDAREALYHARASVVASGTATLQAALIGNPFIIVYRVSWLTYRLAKRLIRYPVEIPAEPDARGNLPIGMVNLIAGRRVAPELLQDEFSAENLLRTLVPLLEDGPMRTQMVADLAEVRRRLSPAAGAPSSIQRVCGAVLEVLEGR